MQSKVLMSHLSIEQRRQFESLDRELLEEHQLARVNNLLSTIRPQNKFYATKLVDCPQQLESLEQLTELPMTTKEELVGENGNPTNVTWPLDRYVRYHQTSGTRGRPLTVLDTSEDWQWWVDCWQYVLDAAQVTESDRAMLAFSFGPFIGFWSAHDALVDRGTLAIPGGGMSTLGRLEMMQRTGATVLFCTPTYALHLGEVAKQNGFDLAADLQIRKIVVAGEPGGSIPATCARIEAAWGAQVTDHSGASEVGPWGFGDTRGTGLHVLESEFVAEFISVETGKSAAEGELAQLVLTPLGRSGMPVIRYQTGDLVRPYWPTEGENRFVLLSGGVLGRTDDMFVVRGVNIFPSSIEEILHSFPEVAEYRFTIGKRGELDEMLLEVEDLLQQPSRIAEALNLRLGLRVEVQQAEPQSLPRYEGKGRRFIDERKSD
ncbi:Phenylacetate-coenzyme A ligase [Bythopirellula goksoeyrii]|uniref:Phenylacetate-coenzyme A ligase n=2 Tax=Bythopirellula goksoeyrii TaxID=1400387 RepID=A0A5B9QSM9_9BACT|nr:Phenylacetate-coenzyme A ligase [Bythopirellula goksoeyrii]